VPEQDGFADALEVGLTVLAEGDELAIEHASHGKLLEEPDVLGHVPAAPAADAERPFGRDDRAEPIPLDFIRPFSARR
jgi:hypothetical protein